MNPINIRPYRPEDAEPLTKAAAEDGHGVYCPSFVLEKNGEIVGYFSVAVPVVLSWQHSKKTTPLDATKEIGFIEGALAQSPFVAIPCDPESPFMPFLPKQGYKKYFKQLELFIKVR